MLIRCSVKPTDRGVRIDFRAKPQDVKRMLEEFICRFNRAGQLIGIEILFFTHLEREYEMDVLSVFEAQDQSLNNSGIVTFDAKHDAFDLRLTKERPSHATRHYLGSVLLDASNRLVGLECDFGAEEGAWPGRAPGRHN